MADPDRDPGAGVYFYELHESEGDLFTDVLLVHDAEYDEEGFLEIVLEARAAVMDSFNQDSLVEAVAAELERQHGFTFVHDARLTASVDVSREDGATTLAELSDDAEDEDDEDEDEEGAMTGFRSVVVDLERNRDIN
jgi:hypothetical protein